MWHSGAGKKVTIEEILQEINKHSQRAGGVFICCDSQIIKDRCVFSTVICLHGAHNQKGGYYFFKRHKREKSAFPTMLMRLLREVELSIQMGLKVLKKNPTVDIEIHIDANSKSGEKTSKFADMLMGYARGAGFKCRVKPDAWASNSVADKHSK